MTITTTITSKISLGNKRMIVGRSVLSGGSASGDVVTGLTNIDAMTIAIEGSAQMGSSINETFPLRRTDPTVVVETANATFDWVAIGNP